MLLRAAFYGEHETLAPQLHTTPLLQLAYLRSLLPPRGRQSTAEAAASSHAHPSDWALAALEPADTLPEPLHDAYVKLLCVHAPRDVRAYLEAHDEYRLDVSLEATQVTASDEHCCLSG